ncbi:MAG: AlpA family transcriptional regulator [Acidobacteriota bacterium]|nr:AlpA family transcriptional regulator [Acidobacteriota bacterium]
MRMLRLQTVLDCTGLSRSTLYELIREGSFPKPVRLGAQAAGWYEAEVDGWIHGRVAESRSEAGPPPDPADS